MNVKNDDNKNMAHKFDDALNCLDSNLKQNVMYIPSYIKEQAQEIRLRVNRPISIYCANKMYYLTVNKQLSTTISNGKMVICTKEDIKNTFQNICRYSVYSFQNEIVNGFVTISGGHRVGICGTAVYNRDKIENIKDISSINIRIARQVFGCATDLIEKIGTSGKGVLLCGSPSCGKTTVLRDMARQLSVKYAKKVAVVDERGEIAGTYLGVSQNDLGQSDILDGYKKGEGILQAVRSLSPDIVICDEVGTTQDIKAIEQGLNTGVSVIATIHASSAEELLKKPQGIALLESGAFEYAVFFKGREQVGQISQIMKVEDLLNGANNRSNNDSVSSNLYRLCNFQTINK